MVQPSEIEAALLTFLQREVFAPEVSLTEETDLIASGFDSLSLVRTLVFVETTYGVWIPESEINGAMLSNVRSMAQTVARLLHER
jgi:acyl carrier protein